MDVERLNNESGFDFIKRIVQGKLVDKTITDKFEDLSELVFGEGNCFNESEVRKRFYGIKRLLEVQEKEKVESFTDTKVKDELDFKIQELKKERVKVQTEKLELNRIIREQARNELYLEKLSDAVSNITPLLFNNTKSYDKYNEKQGLVCISDMHFGKEVEIKDLKGNIINKYNEKVFEERMWHLLNQIVEVIEKENLDKVNVFNLSDCIEGILRVSQLQSLQYGIIDSVIKFSDFMANWLNELSKYAFIDYSQCWGNHDEIRILTGKKGDFPNENVNKLIMHYIELRLKDNKNIIINNEDKNFIYEDILGLKVFGYHGEDKNLIQTVKDFSIIYGENIDLMLAGHLHSSSVQTVGIGGYSDIECIRIPSICGIDDFSIRLRRSAKAGSKLFILEKGKGKTTTYDFYLN